MDRGNLHPKEPGGEAFSLLKATGKPLPSWTPASASSLSLSAARGAPRCRFLGVFCHLTTHPYPIHFRANQAGKLVGAARSFDAAEQQG